MERKAWWIVAALILVGCGRPETGEVGTSGRSPGELTIDGFEGRAADDVDGQLTDTLDRLIDADPILRERDVNFIVSGGVVAIIGEVRIPTERARVERIIRATEGVKRVDNRLQIVPER